ncbi:unnamed protein product [Closterium sp. Naga37s-1]|nr:unnamed protein product [Closterium sp. Naga37s-1]
MALALLAGVSADEFFNVYDTLVTPTGPTAELRGMAFATDHVPNVIPHGPVCKYMPRGLGARADQSQLGARVGRGCCQHVRQSPFTSLGSPVSSLPCYLLSLLPSPLSRPCPAVCSAPTLLCHHCVSDHSTCNATADPPCICNKGLSLTHGQCVGMLRHHSRLDLLLCCLLLFCLVLVSLFLLSSSFSPFFSSPSSFTPSSLCPNPSPLPPLSLLSIHLSSPPSFSTPQPSLSSHQLLSPPLPSLPLTSHCCVLPLFLLALLPLTLANFPHVFRPLSSYCSFSLVCFFPSSFSALLSLTLFSPSCLSLFLLALLRLTLASLHLASPSVTLHPIPSH